MEYRYADTYDCESTDCYACGLDISSVTRTSHTTIEDGVVVFHFPLCIPCGDKMSGIMLTEAQKLRRDRMLRLVDEFVEQEKS